MPIQTTLIETVERLSRVSNLAELTETVALAARKLCGADGATFVLRDRDHCYYIDENALSPLFKGGRYPLEACISGWAMLHKEIVVVPDIYRDERIPHKVYRRTFVKSLCMFPIRSKDPIGAIGNYWSDGYLPTPEQIKLLQALADSTAVALENLELRNKIAQLESGDRIKEMQLAMHTIAHDLKNPLAVIKAFTGLMESHLGMEIDDQVAGYLYAINSTTDRAARQIQAMLKLYNLQNHKVKKEAVDISQISGEVARLVHAQESRRQVVFKIEPGLKAAADPFLIRVALENLLSNAFKYTGKKPAAFIQVSRASSGEFFVRDNGEGFEPAQASRLFQPLVRLHGEDDFPGTGLGLASVARIIDLHGGRMRAEGRKSEGATFFFTLPT